MTKSRRLQMRTHGFKQLRELLLTSDPRHPFHSDALQFVSMTEDCIDTLDDIICICGESLKNGGDEYFLSLAIKRLDQVDELCPLPVKRTSKE